jgi:signal transduction histidine kinase
MFFYRLITASTTLFILIGCFSYHNSISQIRIQNFGIAEGLPQSQVYSSLVEDNQGYLWVGTMGGGLSRFDGKEFETFTTNEGLVNNFVRDLVIDSTNRIWIATNKGISMFDGKAFHNIHFSNHEGVYVTKIFINRDDIMYLMKDGKMGKVWYDTALHHETVGTIENFSSVCKSNSGSTFILENTPGQSRLLVYGQQNSIAINTNGRVRTIYSSFDFGGKTILSTNDGLFNFTGSDLVQFNKIKIPIYYFNVEKKYFIGVSNSKLSLIDVHGTVLKEMSQINYLILSSKIDKEGTLWLGTDQGLFKIYPYDFENPLMDTGRQDAVHTICIHDGKMWIGTTYQGIKVYDGNKLIKHYDFGSKAKNYVTTMKEDRNGELWIGTVGGVAIFRKEKFLWQHESIIKSGISLGFDMDNNPLIAGANSALYILKNEQVTSFDEFKSVGVWCVKYNEAHDYFALGTSVGLKIFKQGETKSVDIQGLNGKEISTLDWLNDGTLLIGTLGDGIFIYSFKTGSVKRISVSEGLISNTLFFIFYDRNQIWAGSERGIDLIKYEQTKMEVQQIDHFNDAEGLIGLETGLNAVCRKDSLLFFGLVKGLYQYHNSSKPHSGNRLHIKAVNLFNKPFSIPELNLNSPSDSSIVHSFNYDQNHFTFSFNKINKRNPEKYFYNYKLIGFDQIWSGPSQLKNITYNNLAPGAYSLELKATDKSGTFIYDKTSFRFKIVPAFYQTSYFKFLVTLMILAVAILLTYFAYRVRANRVQALQMIRDSERARLRAEIARDFHDELGNQVARMINYVGLLRISKKLEKDIYQTLNGYSQTILNGAKDFVWALDPKNDDLPSVMIHLKDFGEKMFSEKNMQFRFYGDLYDTKLPMGYGRQINLIFKEAMTNAFKHSEAKAINFSSEIISPTSLIIQLKDDGKGLNENEILNSERGIENMRLRAHKINSTIQFHSTDHGTEVKLTVIIPENII